MGGQRIVSIALAACGGVFVLLFLWVALQRMSYPFELEWMEGSVADHVRRILEGQPLYVEPSVDFTPFLYTPLYFYLSALASQVLGFELSTLRLVSLLASCGSLGLIAAFVCRETRSPAAGVAAAGLYAGTYALSGSWFDLARVDALFIFLVLGSAYLLRFHHRRSSLLLSALAMALAFATKQNAILIAAALSLYSLLALERGKKLIFPVAAFSLMIGGSLVANAVSNGWFYFYVFDVPAHHRRWHAMTSRFWLEDIAGPLWIAALMGLGFLAALVVKRDKVRASFHLPFIASLFLIAWSSRLHTGGYVNVLMPAFVALALCFGSSIQLALHTSAQKNRKAIVQVLVAVAALSQFWQLRYDAQALIPKATDRKAGEELLETIRSFDGEVLLPTHGHLGYMAGKRTYAHFVALFDIVRSDVDPDIIRRANTSIRQTLARHPFDAIILDDRRWHIGAIEEHYTFERTLFQEAAFIPVTGKRSRPHLLYRLDPAKLDPH